MPSGVYKLRSRFSMGYLIIWQGTLPTSIKPRLNAWLETLVSPSVIFLGGESFLANFMDGAGRRMNSCWAETLSALTNTWDSCPLKVSSLHLWYLYQSGLINPNSLMTGMAVRTFSVVQWSNAWALEWETPASPFQCHYLVTIWP